MKKFFPVLLLSALLLSVGGYAAGDIAFIDLQEAFKQFYKTQLAQDQIQQQADDIKVEREAMEVEVKQLKEEIETLRADSRDETLSEEIRKGKMDQLEESLVKLQKSEQDLIDFEKLRKQQLEQQNNRMSRKLFDEIHEAVIAYAKEKNFDAVIDRSAQSRNGLQTVLYVDPQKDITADVLAILNEGREVMPAQEPTLGTEQ